jgi:phosphate transport system substrate-binding protein
VTLAGSTTVQPLAEKFAEAFMTANPKVDITVQGGGSSVGVKAAADGTANIGMASRDIKDSEKTEFPDLNVFVIARDGIAIVVNEDVAVADLTIDQIKGIFGGTITNWKEVGGDDKAIIVVSREEGSGTRAAFEEMVLGEDVLITDTAILQPSNGSVRTTVSTTPDSVGYLSFGYLDETTKAVAVEGVEPTEENASDGSYPIVRPLNMITKGAPEGAVKAFLDFILSEEGQAIVSDEGYISVLEKPLSGTVTLAGSTTVQPLAEKFAEAFMTANPDVEITVLGGGSSVGVKAAAEGTANIGMASRDVKNSEMTEFPDLNVFVIARDGIAIVASADVAVDDLTIDQIKGIFGGTITNWKEVGGADAAIIVVSREEGSRTRAAFEEMVLGEDVLITDTAILQPSNGSVRTTVSTTPNSIGYLSFGYLDESVKALQVEGVAPTEENAANGTYPIVRPLNMLTNGAPKGVVKAFLDFILSADGQAIVSEEGYIAVK